MNKMITGAAELDALQKVHNVLGQIRGMVIERNDLIEGMAVATISNDALAVLGPKGTAKTLAGKLWLRAIDEKDLFMITCSPGTPIEMEQGAADIDAYTKTGEFFRNTKGMMSDCSGVLLDECDKDSDANRIAQYSIIHPEERYFFNGSKGLQPAKAKFVYLTMNQYDRRDILVPYFDRVALKYIVDTIVDANARRDFLTDAWNGGIKKTVVKPEGFGWDTIAILTALMDKLEITADATSTLEKLDDELRKAKLYPSDRRMGWVPRLAKATAILAGRMEVIGDDLLIAKHMLWENIEDIGTVEEVVNRCIDQSIPEAKLAFQSIGKEIEKLNQVRKTEKNPARISDAVTGVILIIDRTFNQYTDLIKTLKEKGKDASQIVTWQNDINQIKKTLIAKQYNVNIT